MLSGALFFSKTGTIEERGVLGGPSPSELSAPSLINSAYGAELPPTAIEGNIGIALTDSSQGNGYSGSMPTGELDLTNDALKDIGSPVGLAFARTGMIPYVVQGGDTLSKIASYFGITIDTIVSANPGVRSNYLSVGQTLNILPTSGVVYQAKSGDTLQSIADEFGISEQKISQFNRSVNFSDLSTGIPIIIPGGKNSSLTVSNSTLPNYNKYFIMPTDGYNWGILHNYNAVDIANSCGTPVVAAAEGLVIPDENIPDTPGAWNDGYGNFVLIEHPFGNDIETRYAHLEKVLVQPGDYVKQGEEIGLMGETGDATGCHLHFEVIGARNPFAKS